MEFFDSTIEHTSALNVQLFLNSSRNSYLKNKKGRGHMDLRGRIERVIIEEIKSE
jgi:hypothetical protein